MLLLPPLGSGERAPKDVVQIYLFSTGRINQREIEWLRSVLVCTQQTEREQPICAVISSDGWKPQKLMTFARFIINNISNGAQDDVNKKDGEKRTAAKQIPSLARLPPGFWSGGHLIYVV